MTPDVQAAADRDEVLHRRRLNPQHVRDALALPGWVNPEFAEVLDGTLTLLRDQNDARARIIRRLRDTVRQLQRQLAALDPADQPTDPRTAGQHAAADAIQDLTYQAFPDADPQRHRPLTDEPIDRIPTPRGLRYLDVRRRQHPKAEP